MARASPSSCCCLSFLAGDFNSVEEGGVRTLLGRHFVAVFPSVCEIEQPRCTHRTQVRNVVASIARLDRI
eukprot:4203185-Pyramimonas_sp.AAC.1